ncbi:MAG: SDR family NAD(P)-dependent oxidoreductase [Maricaulaceae bacterium]|jgi:NAD(P)-dependent dehydrogenase (short-subunit alcohol dehydrogenase family)
MSEPFDLEGRIAVVTGAASGIGAGLARVLAERGCHLALADVNEVGLAETARQVASNERKVTTHKLDVADRDAVKAFAEEVRAEHGGAHVLINNAGVAVSGTFEQVSEEDFDWLLSINFHGVVSMTRAFLPLLREADAGHIANVSSIFGIIAPAGQTAYSASKFGVRGFTDALRHELAGSSIGVTTIHPGGINTSIAKSARVAEDAPPPDFERIEKALVMPPDQAAHIIVRAIEKRKPRVLVGADAKRAALIERLMPSTYWDLVARNFGMK